MSTLGELLVADGICSQEQVEEAVQNQVIMGGRMGSNLVELGFLDEATLARYLGRQLGLPYLSGELEPDPRALALLDASQADRLEMIPYLVEGRRLQVLCVDPRNITALDEVAFITGLKPDPIVVPEVRLWQLLRRHYGVERGLRYETIASRDFLASSVLEGAPAAPSGEAGGEDLISEEAFAKLYQGRDGFPRVGRRQASVVDDLPFLAPEDLEVVAEEPGPPGRLERRSWQGVLVESGRRSEDRQLAAQAGLPASVPPAPAPEPESSSLDFRQAVELLAAAGDRYRIARILLRHARSMFSRSLLFTVHRGLALGFDVLAEDVDRAAFLSLLVPLEQASLFSLVYHNRAHYLGPLHKTRANIDFLRALGKQVPLSVFAMPVLVRGRVVNIFYGDNGHRQHCSSDIGELLILAQKIGRGYEQLFERKRAAFREGRVSTGNGAGEGEGR